MVEWERAMSKTRAKKSSEDVMKARNLKDLTFGHFFSFLRHKQIQKIVFYDIFNEFMKMNKTQNFHMKCLPPLQVANFVQ